MLETVHWMDERETDRARERPGPRVLIAVDDSPGARRTLEQGLAQAAAQDAEVTVLHVVASRHWRVGRFGPVRAVPTRVRDPLESTVLRDARRMAFDHGVCPRLELIAADEPHEVILRIARWIGAAAIVVGAGRPDSLAAPLGVCAGVLRRAAVPVVVVPV